MHRFLFVDNETGTNYYYIIEWDKPLEDLKDEFRDEYKRLMEEFWDDDRSKREYNDFYDELARRLGPYWITIRDPEIMYHNKINLTK